MTDQERGRLEMARQTRQLETTLITRFRNHWLREQEMRKAEAAARPNLRLIKGGKPNG